MSQLEKGVQDWEGDDGWSEKEDIENGSEGGRDGEREGINEGSGCL